MICLGGKDRHWFNLIHNFCFFQGEIEGSSLQIITMKAI